MSTFALLDGRLVADGVARLARDLTDRSWHSRYASLLTLPELDVGYRLVVAELGLTLTLGPPLLAAFQPQLTAFEGGAPRQASAAAVYSFRPEAAGHQCTTL